MPERPENCTCGANLAENARFCHLCGRPVFEIAPPQIAETALPPQGVRATPPPAARSALSRIGFGNPVALRVAILMSLGTLLMDMLQGANPLFVLGGLVLWGLAGGWCAVLLYRRLTGFALSVRGGAQLGSITGVLTFLSLLVVSTLTMTVKGKEVVEQMKQDPQVAQVLNSPGLLAAMFLLGLVIFFAIVVGPCIAGGALGARFVGRNGANNRA